MNWQLRVFQLSIFVCMIIGLSGNALAQDKESSEKKPPAIEKSDESNDKKIETYAQLRADYTAKIRDYSRRYRAASEEDKPKVVRERPTIAPYRKLLTKLIDDDPTSDKASEIITWWFRAGKTDADEKIRVGLFLKHYAKSEVIAKYIPRITRFLSPEEGEKQLRSLIKNNPFDVVKASSSYEIHRMLSRKVKKLEGEEAKAMQTEIDSLCDSIKGKFAGETDTRGVTFAARIESIEMASSLQIGKPVPDIVGTDIDGIEFKLSDYRGKVTVIDFWGDW